VAVRVRLCYQQSFSYISTGQNYRIDFQNTPLLKPSSSRLSVFQPVMPVEIRNPSSFLPWGCSRSQTEIFKFPSGYARLYR